MVTLNQKSVKIFHKLIEMLPDPDADATCVKIDNTNEEFMPVYFERLDRGVEIFGVKCDHYALAHYYKQNGDLVPDPDMEFAVPVNKPEIIFTMSFQNSIYSTRSVVYKYGQWLWSKKVQTGEASFANIWLNNIKHQQGL